MSKLLLQENPVMIIPSLAVKIGLNEAVVLQQTHFWLTISKHVIKGKRWVYNTYLDWQKQLPFWSVSTIKRTIHSLERQGYLISGNWNKVILDQTKWYTIDYEKLEELVDSPSEHRLAQIDNQPIQIEPVSCSDGPNEQTSLNQAIPKSTSEITSKKRTPVVEIINYLNEQTKTDYKPNTYKTQELIKARLREGFTVEDFKRVIDSKTAEWLSNPRMSKYLRPTTLFGTNFESYLNQKPIKKTLKEEDFDLDD